MNTAAELQQQVAAFLAAGGQVEVVPGFERIALRPAHVQPPASQPRKPRRATSRRPTEFSAEEAAQIRTLAAEKSITEVSRMVGHSRNSLQRLADREGFQFMDGRGKGRFALQQPNLPAQRRELIAERIRAFQGIGLSLSQAAVKSGLGKRLFNQICREHGISWPAKKADE